MRLIDSLRIALFGIVTGLACLQPAKAGPIEDLLEIDKRSNGVYGIQRMVTLAEHGNAREEYSLGAALVTGYPGPSNVSEGLKWLKKAGEDGFPRAFAFLGQLYTSDRYNIPRDQDVAIHWYEKAYDAGVMDAASRLAGLHDGEKALFWYRKGAEGDVLDCQSSLGFFYARGQNVPQDFTASLHWFLKAMAHPNLSASDAQYPQAFLGAYYAHGLGVAPDIGEAIRWYRLAAANSSGYANFALGDLYERGDGVPIDLVEAMRWYERAAERGYQPAQYRLGLAYEKGEGVAHDSAQAFKWLALAIAGCCGSRTKKYEEFEKNPPLFAVENNFLDPETQKAAQRDFLRTKRGLSRAEVDAGEALVDDFEPIRLPQPIP